ncbi:MAG: hypothetical protein ACREJQ_00560, partial [bacterium]
METSKNSRKWIRNLVPALALAVAWVAGSCNGGGGGNIPPANNPPVAPASVQASKGLFTDRIRANWSTSAGATVYQVFRSPNNLPNSFTELSGLVSGVYYDDYTALLGQNYYYYVKAGNAAGFSGQSIVDSGYLQGTPPPPPFNLSATGGLFDPIVRVTWATEPGADFYQLFRGITSSSITTAVCLAQPFPTPPLCNLPGTRNKINDGAPFPADPDASNLAVTSGVPYYYQIRSVSNIYGEGSYSAPPVSALANANPPSPPINVAASNGDFSDKVRTTWTATVGADSYIIVRAPTAPGPYQSLGSVLATVACPNQSPQCQFDDATAVAGVDLFYRVIASNSNGDSPQSSSDAGWRKPLPPACVVASGGTVTAPPTAPCSQTPIPPSLPDKVEISWTPGPAGVQFEVFKSLTANGQYASIGTTTSSTLDDPVTPGQPTFYYKVRMIVNGKPSDLSGAVDGTAQAQPPVPASVQCVQAGGRVNDTFPDKPACAPEPAQSNDNVLVIWNTNPFVVPPNPASANNVFSYRVFRSTNANGPFQVLSDVALADPNSPPPSLAFTDTAALSGVNYYYLVRAQNPQGFSPINIGGADKELGWRKPVRPDGVQATDGAFSDHVTITWSGVAGFNQYQVFRGQCDPPTGGCPRTTLATTSSISYDDINPPGPQGTVYFYWVATFAGTHISDYSTPDTGYATNVAPVPPPPNNVQATDGTFTAGTVRVTWDPVVGANSYQVFRSSSASGPFTAISPNNITSTFYDEVQNPSDIGLTFYYAVKSINANGASLLSAPDSGYAVGTPPDAPSAVHASDPFTDTPAYANLVRISWNAVNTATFYHIRRSQQSSMTPLDFEQVIPSSQLTFDDTSVTPGVRYFFQVLAENQFGLSPPSPSPNGDLGATIPPNLNPPNYVSASPTLNVAPAFTGFIEIIWPYVSPDPSVFYRLFRSDNANGPFLQVGADLFPTSDPTQYCPDDTRPDLPNPNDPPDSGHRPPIQTHMCYEDKIPPNGNVNPGQQYWYKVKSCNTFNCSGLSVASDDGFAFLAPQPPNPPVGLTATPGPKSVTLNWTANTEANLDHYNIYKSTQRITLQNANQYTCNSPPQAADACKIGQVTASATAFIDALPCVGATFDLLDTCYGTRYY